MQGNQNTDPLAVLSEQSPNRRRVDLKKFRNNPTGETPTSTTGEESTIARFRVETPADVRDGKAFRVAIPAHETFTEDGTSNTETLSLSHSLTDPPGTTAVVAYEGGNVATVSSFDTSADEVDVDTSGSGNTIDVFYISDAPASFKLKKAAPASEGSVVRNLYDTDLLLPHSADQYEDPERIETPNLLGLLPTDFAFVATIDAPYEVDLGPISRTNGDALATNAMLSIPVAQGNDTVSGLGERVAIEMVR